MRGRVRVPLKNGRSIRPWALRPSIRFRKLPAPGADNGLEIALVAEGVRIAVHPGHHAEYYHHVGGDLLIHIPEMGQIEPAAVIGIRPCQQEIRYAPALTGIVGRDLDKAFQRGLLDLVHDYSLFA